MVAVATVTTACSGGDGPVAPITTRPASYRIVYRVENAEATSFEELVVQRPLLVLDVTTTARPDGTGATLGRGTLTGPADLYRVDPTGIAKVSGRQPAVGTGDQALGPLLPDLAARKLAQRRSAKGVIAGRGCRVWRFHEPPAGPIKALAGADHDDLCIDGDGLVLSEEWTLGGRRVLRRTAQSVALVPAGAADRLTAAAAGASAPADLSTAAAPTTGPLDRPPAWIEAPAPPSGFGPETAVSFRFPRTDAPGVVAYASAVWAFSRGADLVTVEAGEGVVPWHDDDVSRPTTVAGGGGRSVLRNDGAELRRELDGGRWVRVRGTVPLSRLEAYARALRLTG